MTSITIDKIGTHNWHVDLNHDIQKKIREGGSR